MKIRPVGDELFHVEAWMDEHAHTHYTANSRLSQFRERA